MGAGGYRLGSKSPGGLAFFGFFGTVTQFGTIWIGLIGFFGTVTQFASVGVD